MQILFKVLRNSFFLTIATVVDRAADFVLVLYLARFLGVEDVGTYFLVVSILYLFQNLVNFGLVQLATREVAKDITQVSKLLTELGLIGIGLGSLVTIALFIAIPLLRYPDTVSSGLIIVAFSLLPGTLRGVAEAVFNAVERMEHIAWITGLGGLLRSAISLGVLWAGLGLGSVFLVLTTTQWVVVLLYFVQIFKLYGKPDWQFCGDRLLLLMRPAFVFSAMSIFLVGANNVDALLLSKLGSVKEVGLYAVAFKLTQAVILLRPILMRSLFPSLVRSASNIPELRRVTQHTLRLLIVFLSPLPIVFMLLGEFLIQMLYGPQFKEAVLVLRILGWSILFSYISVVLHRVLLAANRENIALGISIGAMLVNVGGDLLLIPTFGARGAAIASLISLSVALLLAYGWVRWRIFSIEIRETVGRPLLSALLVGFLVFGVRLISPWGSLVALAITYLPVLILTKTLSITEVMRTLQMTQARVSRLVWRQL